MRPVLLALLPLISVVLNMPAKADDCASVADTCLHEVVGVAGSGRVLTVNLLRTFDAVDWYDVITPARAQFEVEPGKAFQVAIAQDGSVSYSVQACWHPALAPRRCNPWAFVKRNFGPAKSAAGAIGGIPSGIGSATAIVPKATNQACADYANLAVDANRQNVQLGCGYTGARWHSNYQAHYDACVGFNLQQIQGETAGRAQDLASCKQRLAAANPPPAPTVRVVAEVTMYDTYKKNNRDLCYLHPGDTLTKLAPNGATGKWLHLQGNSGQCAGQSGYVYNQGELQ